MTQFSACENNAITALEIQRYRNGRPNIYTQASISMRLIYMYNKQK